jgi:hypothetical protein
MILWRILLTDDETWDTVLDIVHQYFLYNLVFIEEENVLI